ncbi:hypothetical protein PAXRUDRAFT_154508, partial [Paxillus rubicundulus Ve08.2h10]
ARGVPILARSPRQQAHYLPYLLLSSKAVPFLMNYMNSTCHLKTTLGLNPSHTNYLLMEGKEHVQKSPGG